MITNAPRTIHLMVDEQFVASVESGRKKQTVRNERDVVEGDIVELRAWKGVPYRSKQRVIATGVVTLVIPILIKRSGAIFLNDIHLTPELSYQFAQEDGFPDFQAFKDYFRSRAPFKGIVIGWRPAQ